jgi:hypothetical protein
LPAGFLGGGNPRLKVPKGLFQLDLDDFARARRQHERLRAGQALRRKDNASGDPHQRSEKD